MLSTGDEGYVMSGRRKLGTKITSYAACAQHCYFHLISLSRMQFTPTGTNRLVIRTRAGLELFDRNVQVLANSALTRPNSSGTSSGKKCPAHTITSSRKLCRRPSAFCHKAAAGTSRAPPHHKHGNVQMLDCVGPREVVLA